MKKHIIGFTIFAFIVGSFVSIWTLFGYFTQVIPNVPKVESDNLPVFVSDKRTSCAKQRREKISYEVADSYYFVDEKRAVTTLKLSWNGYGLPPKNVVVRQKYFNSEYLLLGKNLSSAGIGESKRISLDNDNREIYMTVSTVLPLDKNELKDNIYADFEVSTDAGETFSSGKSSGKYQVVVVHGESSILK